MTDDKFTIWRVDHSAATLIDCVAEGSAKGFVPPFPVRCLALHADHLTPWHCAIAFGKNVLRGSSVILRRQGTYPHHKLYNVHHHDVELPREGMLQGTPFELVSYKEANMGRKEA